MSTHNRGIYSFPRVEVSALKPLMTVPETHSTALSITCQLQTILSKNTEFIFVH